MEWLNYHHLLYFWVVAREGGLVPAGKVLHVTHPTLSAQIKALEERLGEKLFEKSGRKLVLTETGHLVYRYAEEIFSIGREMLDAVKGRTQGSQQRLVVGVVDVVPKLVVRGILDSALSLEQPVRLACYESSFDKLLADLALHTLDVVISDAPVPPGSPIRAFNHLLGETGITFLGTKALVQKYAKGFPRSLDGAPMLLPIEGLDLRRSLNQWFDRYGIKPRLVGEFEDSALMKAFGADGRGLFPAATIINAEVMNQYGVQRLGDADGVHERFYAVSTERKIKNPAVALVCDGARHSLFRAG